MCFFWCLREKTDNKDCYCLERGCDVFEAHIVINSDLEVKVVCVRRNRRRRLKTGEDIKRQIVSSDTIKRYVNQSFISLRLM